MKRSLRLLLIIAPVLVLLLGVPAGVALARRSPPSAPAVIGRDAIATAVANGTPRPAPNGGGPFIGPRGPLLGPPLPLSQAQNGIAGVVTRVGPDRTVVYTRSKRLAFVEIDPTTTIRFQGKNIKASEVMRGDLVTVLGRRDREGAFHAQLIRVTRPERPDPPPGGAR